MERGQDSCQLYLKAAFSEIRLHGRDETVGATTCCQVRVSDARRAIVFQCKSDMPHGGRGFHPNCFFCGACARAKEVAIYGVLILCTRWCLNVRERRAPESQTPPIFPRFPPSLASLASLSLLLLLSAPLPLPLPAARCPLWWLIGVASRHFVSHFIVRWCFRILKESDHAMSELCGVSISQVPPVCVNSVTNWLPSMFILSRAKL